MSSFVRAGGAALAAAVLSGVGLLGVSGPAAADPPGNNGTVKIIGEGDINKIPENNPHVGCRLGVEWYGFDKGDDVVSKVSFELHAPTTDGELTVDGPAEVPVGGDDAGGGSDLDGRVMYTLSATGTPHPKQGFHVKLTVHTPRSHGNDSKTKVFWFKGCAAATATASPSAAAKPTHDKPQEKSDAVVVTDEESATPTPAQATGSDSAVPTSIDAGLAGSKTGDPISVPPLWPIIALLAAAAAVAGGLVVMARRRAADR